MTNTVAAPAKAVESANMICSIPLANAMRNIKLGMRTWSERLQVATNRSKSAHK
jgi:hypothetical protein